MATALLSPTPVPVIAMSTKRGPLTDNLNAANSPLRGAAALAAYAKQKRSHATLQREEIYGQPPPVKRLAVEAAVRRIERSPTKPTASQTSHIPQRTGSRPAIQKEKRLAISTRESGAEKEAWKKHHRARFPQMVFYFESIPDDVRARLNKKVAHLGGRQEPFFSIAVTHVVTTRPIPPEQPQGTENRATEAKEAASPEKNHQPQTINPSLLDRNASGRRLLFGLDKNPPKSNSLDDSARSSRGIRNSDILHKARGMGKKIYSLEKFQHMIAVLLEPDAVPSTAISRGGASRSQAGTAAGQKEPNLLELLNNERINGPSDRDPTAVNRELNFFKGSFLYVWDMDEKQKPMMVREYAKVANKADGDWPQFRSVGNGRCPFIEEAEPPTKEHRKPQEERARALNQEKQVPAKKVRDTAAPQPITGKRTLAEMEDGNNRNRGTIASTTSFLNPAKAALSRQAEVKPQNAFISRAGGGRLHDGEPVASGLQQSAVTSAIRSQMISSTSGVNGAKAGTSKEVHGLQRKVLQKAAPTTSHDASSRRLQEVSMDVASSRSATMSRQNSKLVQQDEDSQKTGTTHRKAESQTQAQPLKSKKDLKPGYCENCQDRYRDFDEHIESRKHRRFAENNSNWDELDNLLSQLIRKRKRTFVDSDVEEDEWM